MTEQEWLANDNPVEMLTWIQGRASCYDVKLWVDELSDRQLRLYATAAAHAADQYDLDFGESNEDYRLDGSADVLARNWMLDDDFARQRADLLRDIVGNPYQLAPLRSKSRAKAGIHGHLHGSFITPDVLSLAHAAYDERCSNAAAIAQLKADVSTQEFIMTRCTSDESYRVYQRHIDEFQKKIRVLEKQQTRTGVLDLVRLLVLADALEEIGCTHELLLQHLRNKEKPHVRGCWALDCILRKE